MEMNHRVYGILGISAIMANWNADFSGFPKTTTDGRIFGSDKAFKYPMKKMWDSQGEKVLYLKSYRWDTNNKKGETFLIPKTLRERYEQLFGAFGDKKDAKLVLTNLFQAIDVKNFGATFAESGMNISITGAVQLGQGFNRYDDTAVQEQPILSPFRDPSAKEKNDNQEEAKNSTLGTKIVSNEAHYFYPFTINPRAYQEYIELGVTQGYTQEDYMKFKKAALCAATSYATNAKVGCENEFAFFVETESDLYLPNLSEYVSFEKGQEGELNRIDLKCEALLAEESKRICSIEIYYNPYTTVVSNTISGAVSYNIFTGKEIC